MKVSRSVAVFSLCCTLALVLGTVYIAQTPAVMAAYAAASAPVVIIDPGHGGADGGAVGVDGVVEKDLNLAIASTLAKFFRFCGCRVVMTRTEDVSIHDPGVEGLKRQKTSDLHNRLALMQQYPEGIVLSIHQNQFTQAKYSGGQVFYGTQNPKSSRLAQLIQTNLKGLLQPENNREIKEAYDTLYLMQNAPSAAVLVECGFLSNPEEAARLAQPEYQRRLAFVVCASTLQFIQEEFSHGYQV